MCFTWFRVFLWLIAFFTSEKGNELHCGIVHFIKPRQITKYLAECQVLGPCIVIQNNSPDTVKPGEMSLINSNPKYKWLTACLRQGRFQHKEKRSLRWNNRFFFHMDIHYLIHNKGKPRKWVSLDPYSLCMRVLYWEQNGRLDTEISFS